MGITSALVLYAVIWFLTFLVVIPIRLTTQGEAGTTVPGTHHGSPEVHNLGRKARLTTAIAAVLWAIIAGIIITETVTMEDVTNFVGGGATLPRE